MDIFYGPNFQKEYEDARHESRLYFKLLSDAIDKVDPEGKISHAIASKYRLEVVKGDQVIKIPDNNNITAQKITEGQIKEDNLITRR